MQFLRENKITLIAVLTLPVFMFKLDPIIVAWLRYYHQNRLALYDLWQSLSPVMKFLGHGSTVLVVIGIILLIGRFFNRHMYVVGKYLSLGFISSGIIVQVLKHILGRARPWIVDHTLFIGPTLQSRYDSFPSGHTTVIFCLAFLLSNHFQRYRYIFYLFAAVVGLERIVNISHFPSDVIAGSVVGIAVGKLLVKRLKFSIIGLG